MVCSDYCVVHAKSVSCALSTFTPLVEQRKDSLSVKCDSAGDGE